LLAEGVLMVNDEDLIQYVNPALCELFGYESYAALLGKQLGTLIPPSLQSRHTNYVTGFFQRNGSKRMMSRTVDLYGWHKVSIRLHTIDYIFHSVQTLSLNYDY
jgi:PAS domain S-box-containing protein